MQQLDMEYHAVPCTCHGTASDSFSHRLYATKCCHYTEHAQYGAVTTLPAVPPMPTQDTTKPEYVTERPP